ncbi:CocE/NonD family hydrolase [Streptosporangium subroseum]|uniref:CocE/NonD family hydrolase n=1 Tax=Streptosporangium subroseum TaxID=106412 RepID=UPI0034412759
MDDNIRPAAYPAAWQVPFDAAGPLAVAPPAPFDATDDGFYRQPYWAERYTGFESGVKEYPAGYVTHEGGPALQVALRKDQDTAIELRDGTVIYADVFRAADTPADAKLPAILAWSPYGKTTPKNVLSYKRYFTPVPAHLTSGFAQVEGPDPAYWIQHGYAVVNVDHRGVNKSAGDVHWWGSVNAADTHDVIEWIAEQPWSNGKVGLSGVSWLGVQQWWAAADNPPEALAAIAPRSHFHDVLRQFVRIGGITGGVSATALISQICQAIMGEQRRERMDVMVDDQPLNNAYWADKTAKVENIDIPVYQVAGPAMLSSATFPFLPDGNKWLRLAPSYHLDDYYTPAALETERRFFDRYLKDIDNGWERDTPIVQISVLEPGRETSGPARIRTARSWPVENTAYRKLYLDPATATLGDTLPATQEHARYDARTGKATFSYTFSQDTEVTGFLKVKLWVEAKDATDMDLFINAAKVAGAAAVPVGSGQQRVSLRELDHHATHWLPIPSLTTNRFLAPGEVVPVEISLRSTFLIFRAGEQLVLDISGNPGVFLPPLPSMPRQQLSDTDSANQGSHVIRSGGELDSFLQIPTLPLE